MDDFAKDMHVKQVDWRAKTLGRYGKTEDSYPYVLNRDELVGNFFPPIGDEFLRTHGKLNGKNSLRRYAEIPSLVSSLVQCANLYWPFRNAEGYKLLAGFIEEMGEIEIGRIVDMVCDYRDENREFGPEMLLNERENIYGTTQTTPDIGIKFFTDDGRKGIILAHSVFVEQDFGMCPGYTDSEPGMPVNPDKSRCLMPELIVESHFSECHLFAWGRRYWDLLFPDLDKGRFVTLDRCPMSSGVDRLFRLQALAKGLEGKYDIAVPCVLTDSRNEEILYASSADGLGPFPDGWRELFPRLPFLWLSHGDWVSYVNREDGAGRWREWSDYIRERYGYA